MMDSDKVHGSPVKVATAEMSEPLFLWTKSAGSWRLAGEGRLTEDLKKV